MNRQFETDAPNTAWVTDITYLKTDEGFAYLAVVIGLFSRKAGQIADFHGRNSNCIISHMAG